MINRSVCKMVCRAMPVARSSQLHFSSRVWRTAGLVIVACGIWFIRPGVGDDKKAAPEGQKVATPATIDPAKRGAIGVYLYESEDHVLVSKVAAKSPGEKAGLQVGDEIRYFNNERTHTARALMDEIGATHPGTKSELVIRRGGNRLVIPIEIASFASLYPDNPSASAGKNTAKEPAAPPQTMSPETARRMRLLEQQIARLQQELEQLKSTPYVPKPAPPTSTFDINSWVERHRRGENEGDPSLFQ